MVQVTKSFRIDDYDFAYIIRPNEDSYIGTDIVYEEGGEEIKYILITPDALPAVIEALQEELTRLQTLKGEQ